MKLPCNREILSTIEIARNATKQLIELNCQLLELTRSHRYLDCVKLFNQINSSHHLKPDHYTLSTTLIACINLCDISTGDQLHVHSIKAGFRNCSHVSNTLLSLYAKSENLIYVKQFFSEVTQPDIYTWTILLSACTKLGQLDSACFLLDRMPHRNTAAWNAIITGCAENGNAEIAFNLFRRMHFLGYKHDNYTFASVLSLCSSELLHFGRQVHSLVIRTGFFSRASVINAQLSMYFHCGNDTEAYIVFEEAEVFVHDCVTYNAMIAGLVSNGREKEALTKYKQMFAHSIQPTELTFVSVISSCSSATIGDQVYTQAIKMGYSSCTSVSNATISMFANCGDMKAAQIVFQRLEEKDLISWNTMITSYAQGHFHKSAIVTYLEMRRAAVKPDEFTVGSLLAGSEFINLVETIQALVLKNGLILIVQVSNALASAFSKHGKIKQAYLVFTDISTKNLISWNTIISGLLLNGFPVHGLQQFSELLRSNLKPNVCTLSNVLSICASISNLRHGKQVHNYIIRFGFSSETSLSNVLITMYAKCGTLDGSLRVFDKMIERDTLSWNALISAYSQHGKGREAMQCFEAMQTSGGVDPDQATFTAVLSACSHAGLVDSGIQIFNSMVNNYGFQPGVDQFSCIVDLLGRAGYLNEAERIVTNMQFKDASNIWWTLFSACVANKNLGLARIVAGFLLEIENNTSTVYVLLSNIYADMGQWEEAAKIRELMTTSGVMKQPGYSWIGS